MFERIQKISIRIYRWAEVGLLYQIRVSYPGYDGDWAPRPLNRQCVYGKRTIEGSAGDRLMKTDSKNNYHSLHELMVQTFKITRIAHLEP